VDLTTDEPMDTPATPPPHDEEDMDMEEEHRYLGPHDHTAADDSSDDGTQRV